MLGRDGSKDQHIEYWLDIFLGSKSLDFFFFPVQYLNRRKVKGKMVGQKWCSIGVAYTFKVWVMRIIEFPWTEQIVKDELEMSCQIVSKKAFHQMKFWKLRGHNAFYWWWELESCRLWKRISQSWISQIRELFRMLPGMTYWVDKNPTEGVSGQPEKSD